MAKSIEDNIKLQITPVNENLYFTWQNPPIPLELQFHLDHQPIEEEVEESVE